MFSDYTEFGPSLLGDASAKLNASFRLSNTNVTVANVLRRSILTQTPSVAFRTEPAEKSEVIVTTNTTPLVNEMLTHRIGMIPIRADPLTFNPDVYEFVLDKENSTKGMLDVTAADFKVLKKNPENLLEEPVEVPNAEFFPPDPITGDTVLITRLRPQWNPTAPNERLQLKARAAVSTGTENIRWSPVSQCSYEYTRDNNPEHVTAVFNNWLLAHKKIDDPTTLPSDRIEELKREFNTMEIQRCYMMNEKGEPNDFTFHIESVGVQKIPDIVRTGIAACEALVTRYQDLDGTIPSNVRVQEGDSRFSSIDIIFQNEGHTLGNLLETFLVMNHVEGDVEPKISYAGYKVPHPLRPEMFIRIGFQDISGDTEVKKNTARLVVATVCRKLKVDFRALMTAWMSQFPAAPPPTA